MMPHKKPAKADVREILSGHELVELVKARLQIEDDAQVSEGDADDAYRDQQIMDWHPANPTPEATARNRMWRNAKMLARRGNVEPLRKILTQMTGDPDIADFITAPPAPSRPKYVRRNAPNPFYPKDEQRRDQVEMLRRIRQIVQQEIDRIRDTQNLVIEIAAEVMGCPQREIKELIKRGH
jgi:hypothetical protein